MIYKLLPDLLFYTPIIIVFIYVCIIYVNYITKHNIIKLIVPTCVLIMFLILIIQSITIYDTRKEWSKVEKYEKFKGTLYIKKDE